MRRIVSAKIKFLSLVPRGANQLPVIYKSEDDSLSFTALTKAAADFDEQGELLSVVYAPEQRDSQGDIASGEAIKQMMYDAAQEGMDLDIRHDGKALSKSDAFIAESFIIQKGDPRFTDFSNYKGEKVDVTGGWATVVKIENAELRTAYRDGKWNGVSMAGTAEFASEKQDLDGFVQKLADLIKKPNNGDLDMKPEELTKILSDNNTALTTAIVDGISKALKPEDKGNEKPGDKGGDATAKGETPGDDGPVKKPVLKSATDPKAVAKYQKELTAWQLAKEVDWDNPEDVAEYQKAISAKPEDVAAEDKAAGVEKEDSDEVASLKRQLAKAQSKSNAGGGEGNDKPGASQASAMSGGLSKEDADLFAAGAKAGKAHADALGLK